jgi:hypothetical protein
MPRLLWASTRFGLSSRARRKQATASSSPGRIQLQRPPERGNILVQPAMFAQGVAQVLWNKATFSFSAMTPRPAEPGAWPECALHRHNYVYLLHYILEACEIPNKLVPQPQMGLRSAAKIPKLRPRYSKKPLVESLNHGIRDWLVRNLVVI